jgi:4-hydroxybenzoate polyprenyltransferase
MFLVQAAIGASNDVLDAGHDRVHRPAKPIARGAISERLAVAIAGLAASAGLLVAWSLGPAVAGIAAVGLGCGLIYNARLKHTAWSWVPFAVGLPMLPMFAWLAATGSPPPGLIALLALGGLAGVALTLANGLVDAETDEAGGARGLVVRLGRRRSLGALVAAQTILLVVVASGVLGGPADAVRVAVLVAGGALDVSGALGSAARRRLLRRLGWEAQALGTVMLAIAWLAAATSFG